MAAPNASRPRRRAAHAAALALCMLAAAAPLHRTLHAQRDSSTVADGGGRWIPRVHAMLGAVPLATRATPTAGRTSLTEGYVVHPVAMLEADAWDERLSLHVMANLEGATLERGELSTGAHGEGYVDRRHPHAWLHEAMLGTAHSLGPVRLSLHAGRGFAAFGSDDPMVRPFVKYPLNHHLAQVLERVVAVAAVRAGALTVEASTFNGDEPESPRSRPAFRRFGDSWSARVTAESRAPFGNAVEWALSRADIASPESRAGLGLDHRLWHASARLEGQGRFGRYALLELARLEQLDDGERSFAYRSALAEGAICARGAWAAVRAERTDRPEEMRLVDLFRTPFPHAGDAILGRTSWTVVTAAIGAGVVAWRGFTAAPFVEAAALRPRQLEFPAVLPPEALYGARTLALLSAGARLRVGASHARMGRYGAARPAPAGTAGQAHAGADHQGPSRVAEACR